MAIAVLLLVAGFFLCSYLMGQKAPLAVVAVGVVVIGYVFGHSFWNADLGPITVTTERLALVALVSLFGQRLWQGRIQRTPVSGADWALAITLGWLTLSALLNRPTEGDFLPKSPLWRLAVSFWAPALLFLVTRQSKVTSRVARCVLAIFAALGLYLAFTALAESAGMWSIVFPTFIADPELGLHFGRARGPALNSVSLGIFLSVCLWATWALFPHVSRWTQVALLATLPFMAIGVLLTYTRSTWLGLAASGVAVLAIQLPRRLRAPVLGGVSIAGLVMAALLWQSVLQLQREDSGGVSQHSVQQRTAFAYVSWKMFSDSPLTGVGFGRFYDKKLSYLTDRSQPFELESLRELHHHNTLLGLLTETGMLGMAAYVGILGGLVVCGWRLSNHPLAESYERSLGLLLVATVTIYSTSALFHDLTHIFTDQWLLFVVAGLGVGCERRVRLRACQGVPATEPSKIAPQTATRIQRPIGPIAAIFGMRINRVTLQQATSQVLDWCQHASTDGCRFVVTPNVDHVVMHHARQDLRAAYESASLVLADGAPLVAASRLLGCKLPERVAGSDLTPAVLAATRSSSGRKLRVFLLGAGPGIADLAAKHIARQYPGVEVVGTHCPPLGFEKSLAATDAALQAVAAAQPDLLIVGLGAPKQELWVHEHQHRLQAKVALCVGATIDFLAGHKQRSPQWMQRVGLEWLHRLASEPRRLAARYARDAWVFPQLVWGEWRKQAFPMATT